MPTARKRLTAPEHLRTSTVFPLCMRRRLCTRSPCASRERATGTNLERRLMPRHTRLHTATLRHGIDCRRSRRALQLPENQRLAFTLNKVEGLSYQEVSEVMNTTVSSVESLMHRAKNNLRKKLEDHYNRGKEHKFYPFQTSKF